MALIQCSAIDSSRDSMLRSKRWLRRAAGGACELARAEGLRGHSALRGFLGSEIVLRARKKASGHHLPVHPRALTVGLRPLVIIPRSLKGPSVSRRRIVASQEESCRRSDDWFGGSRPSLPCSHPVRALRRRCRSWVTAI